MPELLVSRLHSFPPVLPPPIIPGGPAPIPAPGTAGAGLQPAPTAPAQPVRSERLQLALAVRDNPVRVNEPIRYTLTSHQRCQHG